MKPAPRLRLSAIAWASLIAVGCHAQAVVAADCPETGTKTPPSSTNGIPPAPAPPTDTSKWSERRIVGAALIGGGIVSVLAGAGLAVSTWFAEDPGTAQGALNLNNEIHRRDTAALVCLGVGGAAILSGAALSLWPESRGLSIAILPTGILALGGRM